MYCKIEIRSIGRPLSTRYSYVDDAMSSVINKDKLTEWAEQALKTLQDAQNTCSKAQQLLQYTSYQLNNKLPEKVQFCTFMVQGIKQQHEIVHSVIESLVHRTNGIEKLFEEEYTTSLEPAVSQLEQILARLKETKVPSFLVQSLNQDEETTNSETAREYSLIDFVPLASINTLKKNAAVYKSNSSKLHKSLRTSLKRLLVDPYDETIGKKYNKVLQTYNEIIPLQLDLKVSQSGAPYKSSNFLNVIIKENSSLESELVSILEMLTNHYDQCVQGKLLFANNTPSKDDINFEVLQNDAKELPEVLKELYSVYKIIINNEARAHKYLEGEYRKIDSFVELANDLLEYFVAFKEHNLTRFMILSISCDEIFAKCSIDVPPDRTPISAYTDAVNHLSYHYTQFLDVFKTKYLSELFHEQYTYPKVFFSKLYEFLNEDLTQLQQEESTRRSQWIAKYGEFIPRLFKLPGEQDQPTVIQVITEGLDHAQNSFENGAYRESADEKQLISLIKSFQKHTV